TEIAGLEYERQRPYGLHKCPLIEIAAQPGIRHDVTADPEDPIEIEAGRRRRLDIEHIERVDERHELAARRGRRPQSKQEGRASGRARADEFRHVTTRDPTLQTGV